MTEEIRTRLENWAKKYNNHPSDYIILYQIALDTYNDKIGQIEFKECVGDKLYDEYYSLIENLWDFIKYLKDNGKYNG